MKHDSSLKLRDVRKARGLIARYRALLKTYTPAPRTERVTLGQQLPLGEFLAGQESYPGPDVTFTPPPSNPFVVSLGCVASAGNTESFSITWPSQQIPGNFATGSGQQRFRIYENHPLTVVRPETNLFNAFGTVYGAHNFDTLDTPSATNFSLNGPDIANDGQPSTQTFLDLDPSDGTNDVSNVLTGGIATPFDSAVTTGLTGFINSISNGYASIQLSQEGLLWTLWPLAKNKHTPEVDEKDTYFNRFRFGTAKSSRYAIGQMGYFYTDHDLGCIPLAASTTTAALLAPLFPGLRQNGLEQLMISSLSATHNSSGVQGFNETLIISTAQLLSLLVVKVSEEVARIPHPTAGEGSDQRFFYVGYDGWSVIRTSNSPVGPMAAQTYVTPQTVTGSTVSDNFQVIIPPNFVQSIYYKNQPIRPPVSTEDGLIPIIPCTGWGAPRFGLCNLAYFNHNYDPNTGPPPIEQTQHPVTLQGPPPGVSAEQFNRENEEAIFLNLGLPSRSV